MPVPAKDPGFALYGPDYGVPWGGFCMSSFLLVRRGDDVLVGRMAETPRWADEWNPNLRFFDEKLLKSLFAGLRLPASYVRLGEHPDATARRVWKDQLGLPGSPKLGTPRIVSEAGPSRRYPDRKHWDICFLYAVEGPAALPATSENWATLEYRAIDGLRPDELVMLHSELVPLLRETKRDLLGGRSDARPMAAKKKKGRGKLTKKQHAQRKYAAKMRAVRGRAKKAGKGKGRLRKRPAAKKLRKRYGLK